MSIITREALFETQAKEILSEALRGFELENLNNLEIFEDDIWADEYAVEIGRKFMEKLSEWNGDDTYQEVMNELAEESKSDEEII
jgi:uncharacterized protein YxjI